MVEYTRRRYNKSFKHVDDTLWYDSFIYNLRKFHMLCWNFKPWWWDQSQNQICIYRRDILVSGSVLVIRRVSRGWNSEQLALWLQWKDQTDKSWREIIGIWKFIIEINTFKKHSLSCRSGCILWNIIKNYDE